MKIEISPAKKVAGNPITGLLVGTSNAGNNIITAGEIILRINDESTKVVVLRASGFYSDLPVPYIADRVALDNTNVYIPYTGPITLSNE